MQVIEELIKLAKDLDAATKRGEELGLTEDEIAFYDALAANESAVKAMGDDKLKVIAAELIIKVRQSVTIDWTLRESARAKIKVIIKRISNNDHRNYGGFVITLLSICCCLEQMTQHPMESTEAGLKIRRFTPMDADVLRLFGTPDKGIPVDGLHLKASKEGVRHRRSSTVESYCTGGRGMCSATIVGFFSIPIRQVLNQPWMPGFVSKDRCSVERR